MEQEAAFRAAGHLVVIYVVLLDAMMARSSNSVLIWPCNRRILSLMIPIWSASDFILIADLVAANLAGLCFLQNQRSSISILPLYLQGRSGRHHVAGIEPQQGWVVFMTLEVLEAASSG